MFKLSAKIMGIFLCSCCLFYAPTIGAKTISCMLRISAGARLDNQSKPEVYTTDNDKILVVIVGMGEDIATFNGQFKLHLIKKDSEAYYYQQPSLDGFIMWVYYPKSKTITYCKLRAFPVLGTPDSYLMIAKHK